MIENTIAAAAEPVATATSPAALLDKSLRHLLQLQYMLPGCCCRLWPAAKSACAHSTLPTPVLQQLPPTAPPVVSKFKHSAMLATSKSSKLKRFK